MSCEFKSTSYKFNPRVTSSIQELRVQIHELRVQKKRLKFSTEKSPSSPMILEKFAFFFAFNLRKENVIDSSFISLTKNFV